MRAASVPAVVVALTVAVAVSVAGCAAADDDAGASLAREVTYSGQSLDAQAFADLAAADAVVVLDVRTPEEFAAGHLAAAVNLDVSAPDFATRAAELDPGVTYAVYCRSGNRSQTAMTMLRDAGVASLADLAGGIDAWIQAGRAVVV